MRPGGSYPPVMRRVCQDLQRPSVNRMRWSSISLRQQTCLRGATAYSRQICGDYSMERKTGKALRMERHGDNHRADQAGTSQSVRFRLISIPGDARVRRDAALPAAVLHRRSKCHFWLALLTNRAPRCGGPFIRMVLMIKIPGLAVLSFGRAPLVACFGGGDAGINPEDHSVA